MEELSSERRSRHRRVANDELLEQREFMWICKTYFQACVLPLKQLEDRQDDQPICMGGAVQLSEILVLFLVPIVAFPGLQVASWPIICPSLLGRLRAIPQVVLGLGVLGSRKSERRIEY